MSKKENEKVFIFTNDQIRLLREIYSYLNLCEKVFMQYTKDHGETTIYIEPVEHDFEEFKKLFEENKWLIIIY